MDVGTSAAIIAGITTVGKPGAELVKDFVGRIFGPTADALGGTMAHPFIEFNKRRADRSNKMLLASAAILEERGHQPTRVPDTLLWSLLNGGSLCEEADLQAVWAQLLASAASGKSECVVLPAFPQILCELTGGDAKFLKYFYDMSENILRSRFEVDAIMKDYDPFLQPWKFYIMFDNLARLRLIEMHPQISGSAVSRAMGTLQRGYHEADAGIAVEPGTNDHIFVTGFGDAFMKACAGPAKSGSGD